MKTLLSGVLIIIIFSIITFFSGSCANSDACKKAEQKERDICMNKGSDWSPENCREIDHENDIRFFETCNYECDCIRSSHSYNSDEKNKKEVE